MPSEWPLARFIAGLGLGLVLGTSACVETVAHANHSEPLQRWLCDHPPITAPFSDRSPGRAEGPCRFELRDRHLLCSDPAGWIPPDRGRLMAIEPDQALLVTNAVSDATVVMGFSMGPAATEGAMAWSFVPVPSIFGLPRMEAVGDRTTGGYVLASEAQDPKTGSRGLEYAMLEPGNGRPKVEKRSSGSTTARVVSDSTGTALCGVIARADGVRLTRLSDAVDEGEDLGPGAGDLAGIDAMSGFLRVVQGEGTALIRVGPDCRSPGPPLRLPEAPDGMRVFRRAAGLHDGRPVLVEYLPGAEGTGADAGMVRRITWPGAPDAPVLQTTEDSVPGLFRGEIRVWRGQPLLIGPGDGAPALRFRLLDFGDAAAPTVSDAEFSGANLGRLVASVPPRPETAAGTLKLFVERGVDSSDAHDYWQVEFEVTCDAP